MRKKEREVRFAPEGQWTATGWRAVAHRQAAVYKGEKGNPALG